MADPSWLSTARSLIGKVEDGPSILPLAQKIGQLYPEMASYTAQVRTTTSWCGEFIAYCLAVNGIKPPFNAAVDTQSFLWALAWASYGSNVATADRKPGDILVFDFGNSDHHVTFYLADNGDGTWQCLGGNQSDQVKVSNYSSDQCIAVRRPAVAETQPTLPPAPQLPTSSGKGSWYSWYTGKYIWKDSGDAPNSNALGVPDDQQGIAFYSRATLGQWFDVTAPNGVTLTLQQTDIGPSPKTGRSIDIAAVAAERFGYSPNSFPTDSTFTWRPAGAAPMPAPTPAPVPAPPVTAPAPIDPAAVAALTQAILQGIEKLSQNPQVQSTFSALLAKGLSGLFALFPQLGVWGLVIQQILVTLGVMGPAVGAGATPTGQVVATGLLGMIGSWLASRLNTLVTGKSS